MSESTSSGHRQWRVGLVGLGRMGANMARRLKDCGYNVTAVYDLQADLTETLGVELGAQPAGCPSEVTALADVIITVVSDDAAMKRIYGEDPNLLVVASGKTFINCATVSPAIHHWVAAQCHAAGAQVLEAPMASSIPQARSGQLYLMCAGEEAVFNGLKPLLADLSLSMIYTGPTGTASSLKALVNMVMNMNTAALAEGLGLADALGLDLTLVRQVFQQTGANSRVLETDGEDMQNRDHETYFSAAHAAKDSRIALALAEEKGLNLPLALATTGQYDRMVATGLGELDKSGISELTFKDRLPAAVNY